MELKEVFSKWKLNQHLFASFIDCPKGTFNNKLNPKYRGRITAEELEIIKSKFKEMIKDLESITKAYPIIDDETFQLIDEEVVYGGRTISN